MQSLAVTTLIAYADLLPRRSAVAAGAIPNPQLPTRWKAVIKNVPFCDERMSGEIRWTISHLSGFSVEPVVVGLVEVTDIRLNCLRKYRVTRYYSSKSEHTRAMRSASVGAADLDRDLVDGPGEGSRLAGVVARLLPARDGAGEAARDCLEPEAKLDRGAGPGEAGREAL